MLQAPAIAGPALACGFHRPQQAIAIIAVLASIALVVLDAAMMNVAVPTLADNLRVAPASGLHVVSVYQTALVMALFPCAALGESLGYRRTFLAGVSLFVTASVFGATASSLGSLIAARFLQGLGGAAIMALGIALLRQALPTNRIGAAIGWNALTVALCSAAGPSLAAVVLSIAGWKGLFLVHLPLGLVALAAGNRLPTVAGTKVSLDLVSMILSAGGFASLLFGAGACATFPAIAGGLLTASAICFWSLVRREMPKRSPMVPLDLLRGSAFRTSVIASVCCFAGQTAGLLALPFYLQLGLGETPLGTGLYMTAWPMAVAVAALLAGRLADRLPAQLLCAAGAGLLAAGLFASSIVPTNGNPLWLVATTIPCGLGFGLFQVPNNRTMFLSAPLDRSAAAGGMQGTARLTGQTSGAVLMTLLFVWAPAAAAPRLGLAVGGMFALAAAIISAMQTERRNNG